MKYRAEIDGLRAVAVAPVILFHAGFTTFGGGYVGVDIFFVISGYLITTIIMDEIEAERFSLVAFYERRARRILPALIFVALFCVPFAWLWLSPKDMKDFAQSLMGIATFSSNFLFWQESGYFESDAELKPLLHTWSLSVEEQYYVLFPIILSVTWKFGRCFVLAFLITIFIASLSVAHWGAYNKPAASFFLLPTRGWEILLGTFCAFLLKGNIQIRSEFIANSAGTLGLFLIGFSVFTFDQTTPMPSLQTLIPTMGAVLLILFAREGSYVQYILASKVLVGLGVISYSAYLWHQPIFAFVRHAEFGESIPLMSALSLSAVLLGWLSWAYVERPFRNRHFLSRQNMFAFSGTALLVTFCLGIFGHLMDGFKFEVELYSNLSGELAKLDDNIFVLGDSHADHLVYGLRHITTGEVVNYSYGGCIPFRNVDRYDSRFVKGECAARVNGYLDEILNADADGLIVLSTMGPVYLDGTPFKGKDLDRVTGLGVELVSDKSISDRWEVFEIGLRNTLAELGGIKNSRVVFVIDIPELGINFGCNKASKAIFIGNLTISDLVNKGSAVTCSVSREDYDLRATRYKDMIRRVLEDYPSVFLFDPTSLFCDEDRCYGYKSNIGFLYLDADHLSNVGSLFVANGLAEDLVE